MDAKKDSLKVKPTQVTNIPREGVSSTQTSLGRLLKQLKAESSTASSQSSSSRGDLKTKFQQLFSAYESGALSRKDFAASLQTKLSITVDPKVERLIDSQEHTYSQLVSELGLTGRDGVKGADYYSSPQVGSVRNSYDLTTLAARSLSDNKSLNSGELTQRIKQYSQGALSKNEFISYLNAHEVPLTPDIERKIREHETTQSVNFHTLGRSIFKALTDTPRLSGSPTEKDPTPMSFLNTPTILKTSAETKEQMRQEALLQELDMLGTGVYSGHKRKVEPPAK
jgi:hypothetical protein